MNVQINFNSFYGTSLDIIRITKVCIKSAPYLHQISANLALDIVLFRSFDADLRIQI
jgi:hypothetical protein